VPSRRQYRPLRSGCRCTEGLFAKMIGHELQAAHDFFALALNPVLALLFWRAFGFEKSRRRRIADTVSQASQRLTSIRSRLGAGKSLLLGVTASMYSTITRESKSWVSSSSSNTGILPSGLMCGTLLSASQGESMTKSYSIFFQPARHELCVHIRAGMGADQLHHMLSDLRRKSIIAYGAVVRRAGKICRLTEKDAFT
jgi:hypothetical protein